MHTHEGRLIPAPLTLRTGPSPTAPEAAAAVVDLLSEIQAVLAPILGPRGVTALVNRARYLSAGHHACLSVGSVSVIGHESMHLGALGAAIGAQDDTEALAAGNALFAAFEDLLTRLVGPSLTQRLLQPIWANEHPDPTAQDASP